MLSLYLLDVFYSYKNTAIAMVLLLYIDQTKCTVYKPVVNYCLYLSLIYM